MKRNIIMALTVTVAVAIALSVRINDAPPIEISSPTEEPSSIDIKTSIVELANGTPTKDATAVRIDNVLSIPIEEELADSDESIDANSAIALSMETQDFVSAVVYEAVASPDVSSVAYLDKIECSNSGCDIDFKFYDTLPIHRKTAALMESMNARLEEHPSTEHLQFGITMLTKGDDGIGDVNMVIMPRQEKKFTITIVEDLLPR